MMVTIVLLFTICWAPFHTVHMLFEYCKNHPSSTYLKSPCSSWCFSPLPDDLENKYDGVTINMIIAVVQAIGFFNSFNNPIVYAFMNENFKKSCVSTLSQCIRKPNQQLAAAVAPRLSVHFIKPQSREAFVEADEARSLKQSSAEKGPASSSQGHSSAEATGEKISTIQTELPANTSSQVKWGAEKRHPLWRQLFARQVSVVFGEHWAATDFPAVSFLEGSECRWILGGRIIKCQWRRPAEQTKTQPPLPGFQLILVCITWAFFGYCQGRWAICISNVLSHV